MIRALPLPRPRLQRRLLALLLALLPLAPATAQNLSPADVLAAEILPGWRTPEGNQMAALRLKLKPGWKTYWRSPGDAGIPPRFSWDGSSNLAAVTLHWPAPAVFESSGMRAIGYHDELVLPIELHPREARKPMILAAQLEIGVCRDICVPTSVSLKAALPSPGRRDGRIDQALNARPRSAREAGATGLRCTLTPDARGATLKAELRLPPGPGREFMVIETADPGVWVSEPELSRKGDRLEAVARLQPQRGQALAFDRSGVTVTVLNSRGAIELKGCPAG